MNWRMMVDFGAYCGISQSEVVDDGIVFDPASDVDYSGVRIRFLGYLDSARIHMQIDIGFGDVMTPGPEEIVYPTILDFPAPKLSGYSRETVIAEKLQALVQLRMFNTRMKDYFDLWLLTRQTELKKEVLAIAITRTFQIEECKSTLIRSGFQLPSAMIQPSKRSGVPS